MGGWVLLPRGIDLPCYEALQDRENHRNPIGLIVAYGVGSVADRGSYVTSLWFSLQVCKTFTEEILDPKALRKMVCNTTGDSLSMVPATSPFTAE